MQERDWETLVWSLQHGDCILLLGPELPEEDGPSPTDLQQFLEKQLPPGQALPGFSVEATAERYLAELGRSDLERDVVRFHESRAEVPSPTMESLAALPFYFVLTSRHDTGLFKALTRQGKSPTSLHYHYRGVSEGYVSMGTVPAPLLYYLHGSLSDPQSLLLTENDLLDFLVAVVSKNPPLPTSIRAELQKREKCYLFLGFGIRHWYLRILLHVLQLSHSQNRSFALEPLLPKESAERDQTVLFYKTGYRIEVLDQSAGPFLQELRLRFERAGGYETAGTAAARPTPGPSPKVFICHASEDHLLAEAVFKGLETAGFQPWVDTQRLEAGDEWDRVIETRINDSDYFVVLQSPHLAAKQFSYVNKEIGLALRRQGFARPGTRFIIPLRLENADLLEEMSHLEAMPLRGPNDVQALVSTLRRDCHRRFRA